MSASDPINIAFEMKIQSLEKAINNLGSMSDPPKGMITLAMKMILKNILDLYEINREYYIITNQFRNEFVNVLQEGQTESNLKRQLKDLEQRFKTTFGSLENRLNKINEDDEGDNSFYG